MSRDRPLLLPALLLTRRDGSDADAIVKKARALAGVRMAMMEGMMVVFGFELLLIS